MKICFLLNRFPELSQTFVLNQLVGLLELGHDVEILAGGPAPGGLRHATFERASEQLDLARRTTYSGMPDRLPARLARGLLLLSRQSRRHSLQLAKLLNVRRFGWFAASTTTLWMAQPLLERPRRYDAIVAHFGPQGVVAAALREAGLLLGPLTTMYHGYDLGSAPRLLGKGLYRTLFELGESHLSVSQYGLGRLHELGLPPGKGGVMHLGVSVEALSRSEPPVSAAPAERELRLLSIGRLVDKKGFADAIAAVATARAQGVRLSYRIFGSGPLEPKLRRQIQSSGLDAVVRLEGAASETRIQQALRESDVLLAPSVTASNGDREGIPMVLMEALASELAVIATRHGGIPELIRDNETGRLIAENDVAALAHSIRELWDAPGLRERWGRAGRLRVESDFNLRLQTSAFADHLESVRKSAQSLLP